MHDRVWASMLMQSYALVVCAAIILAGCGKTEHQVQEEQHALDSANEVKLNDVRNVYPLENASVPATQVQPEFTRREGVIELKDFGLTFRVVQTTSGASDSRPVFFSETEITNRMYAFYLTDTKQFRDDSELVRAAKTKLVSTVAAAVQIYDTNSLWYKGIVPAARQDHPVTLLTIGQAIEFCDWLNRKFPNHGTFRLPKEEEWVSAAYGRDRNYPWGDDVRDFTGATTESVTARPELRTPDGLYGMWGNVSEFVVSESDGYGRTVSPDRQPFITQWLGPSYQDQVVAGKLAHPRQDYWGYTHSTKTRNDQWGFRVVFVPREE